MRNKTGVILLCFFLLGCVHSAQAAFVIRNVEATGTSLSGAYHADLTNEAFHALPLADSTNYADAKKQGQKNGLQGRLAFTFSMIGLAFQPLGFVAMYFGIRGWKKGKYRRGLAIAGFVLGTIEVLVTLLILALILG